MITREEIKNYINTNIIENGQKAITAQMLNQVLNDIVDLYETIEIHVDLPEQFDAETQYDLYFTCDDEGYVNGIDESQQQHHAEVFNKIVNDGKIKPFVAHFSNNNYLPGQILPYCGGWSDYGVYILDFSSTQDNNIAGFEKVDYLDLRPDGLYIEMLDISES